MKGNKKFWLFAVILLLTFGVLAACSKEKVDGDSGKKDPVKEEDPKNSESFVLGSEPLEITMFGNYDWYTMPKWGDDIATAAIKEKTKVNVTAIDSGGDAKAKLSTMIAGNDLPDFIWTEKGADVEKLRQAGKLVPLDQYMDKYTNLRDWLTEDALNMLRSEDGKLYQFPNWYNSKPFGNAGWLVNKGIYEDLGSPELKTPEDLYAYLKLVKEKYPNVIPFETDVDYGGIEVIYSAFAEGRTPKDIKYRSVAQGDELTSLFDNENYIESLKFSSKLFREGLMSSDALTQDRDMVTEKVTSGRIAVYASASPTDLGKDGHAYLKSKNPDDGYIFIEPIAKEGLDRNKIHPGAYEMLGWNVSVITTDAEDPEKVFAFLDWLTGPEGNTMMIFGPEGKYWEGFDSEGFPNFTDAYVTDKEGLAKVETDTINFQWHGNSNFLDSAKAKFELTLDEDQMSWTTYWQQKLLWNTQLDTTEYYGIVPMPDTPEGEADQQIKEISLATIANAVNAKSDEEVEQILAQASKDAEAAGYSDVLKWQTEKWQANLKKLGKK
ncbi:extracellular solute-binding protein [Ferdinandcohnia quinoae]|uniref:Extracellular solute-binding protein n=1 Tax=Fredinandcohnia quinoae TaxID=2918902 RepID=A0AAW5E2N2_9BACI|nr:extracellular solute-binding protein [Fredinandcohnia sp. SECRCQ15]MCH1624127.1 extracellular solute-binding protein [Fredinandcohnia sp. SECRCQ15]